MARRLRVRERKRIRILGRGINFSNVFSVRLVEEIQTYTYIHTYEQTHDITYTHTHKHRTYTNTCIHKHT